MKLNHSKRLAQTRLTQNLLAQKGFAKFWGGLMLVILTCGLLLSPGILTSWANPSGSMPPQMSAWAHPTNYDTRVTKDVNGFPVNNAPIIVIHETVGSASSAINLFQTPHTNEDDQSSYHALIRLDGTIVYVVPFENRAFGAGNSVFMGANGPEAVRTHRVYPPSVNNFAYHFSLETPPDGRHNGDRHSGYTTNQYHSLAWLIAYTKVPAARITTHKIVDRSGMRKDPRSFNSKQLFAELDQYQHNAKLLEANPPLFIASSDIKDRFELVNQTQ